MNKSVTQKIIIPNDEILMLAKKHAVRNVLYSNIVKLRFVIFTYEQCIQCYNNTVTALNILK